MSRLFVATVAVAAFAAVTALRTEERLSAEVEFGHGRMLGSSDVPCSAQNATTVCGNGVCATSGTCQCNDAWIDRDGAACSYEQRSKLTTFLLSFFVGGVGADWFYLARGNGGYIAAGVFKLLTGGFCGIWVMVDWIRVLANSFNDGNGVGLKPWN